MAGRTRSVAHHACAFEGGWLALQSAVIAGVFTLAGTALGFGGAVAVEFVRSRSSASREVADRRQRFQVETLTRIQEVARELFDEFTARRNILMSRVKSQAATAVAPPCPIGWQGSKKTMSEMCMLAYRVHDEMIRHIAFDLTALCGGMDELSQEELERRFKHAMLAYQAIQETTGIEILRILGSEDVTFLGHPVERGAVERYFSEQNSEHGQKPAQA
jgi:hypothetical protein